MEPKEHEPDSQFKLKLQAQFYCQQKYLSTGKQTHTFFKLYTQQSQKLNNFCNIWAFSFKLHKYSFFKR